jgi:hypothetical protein
MRIEEEPALSEAVRMSADPAMEKPNSCNVDTRRALSLYCMVRTGNFVQDISDSGHDSSAGSRWTKIVAACIQRPPGRRSRHLTQLLTACFWGSFDQPGEGFISMVDRLRWQLQPVV